jgi:hypothetical protein
VESIGKSSVKKYQIYLKLLIISFTIASGFFLSSIFFELTAIQLCISTVFDIQLVICWIATLSWMNRLCILAFILSVVLVLIYCSTFGFRKKRIDFSEISIYSPKFSIIILWAFIVAISISYVAISIFHLPLPGETTSFNVQQIYFDVVVFLVIACCIITLSLFVLWYPNIVENPSLNHSSSTTYKRRNKLLALCAEYWAYYKPWANVLFTAGIMALVAYAILWPIGSYILSYMSDNFTEWLKRVVEREMEYIEAPKDIGKLFHVKLWDPNTHIWQLLTLHEDMVAYILANVVILLGGIGILVLLPLYFSTKIAFLMHLKVQRKDQEYQIIALKNQNATDLVFVVLAVSAAIALMLHYRLEPLIPKRFVRGLYGIIYTSFVSATIFALALRSCKFGYVMIEKYSKKIHNPTWVSYIALIVLFSLYYVSSLKQQDVVFPSDVLFHGSVNRDISILEPRASHVRNPEEGPVVFATPSAALASCYTFIWDDSWVHQTVDNGQVTMVIGDKERFESQDTGGAIYMVPRHYFSFDSNRGLGIYEWVSKEKVGILLEIGYKSSFAVMKQFGVKIYFLSPEEFKLYLKSSEQERSNILTDEKRVFFDSREGISVP